MLYSRNALYYKPKSKKVAGVIAVTVGALGTQIYLGNRRMTLLYLIGLPLARYPLARLGIHVADAVTILRMSDSEFVSYVKKNQATFRISGNTRRGNATQRGISAFKRGLKMPKRSDRFKFVRTERKGFRGPSKVRRQSTRLPGFTSSTRASHRSQLNREPTGFVKAAHHRFK